MVVEYRIVKGIKAPCELLSVTRVVVDDKINETCFVVCEGTHTYCTRIMKELEIMEAE